MSPPVGDWLEEEGGVDFALTRHNVICGPIHALQRNTGDVQEARRGLIGIGV